MIGPCPHMVPAYNTGVRCDHPESWALHDKTGTWLPCTPWTCPLKAVKADKGISDRMDDNCVTLCTSATWARLFEEEHGREPTEDEVEAWRNAK